LSEKSACRTVGSHELRHKHFTDSRLHIQVKADSIVKVPKRRESCLIVLLESPALAILATYFTGGGTQETPWLGILRFRGSSKGPISRPVPQSDKKGLAGTRESEQ
jgi:hypothetical protein